MAAKDPESRWLYTPLGTLVTALVFVLSFTQPYERAELVTYDWRFHLRNRLFGLPAMDPHLGTIDIDNRSLEVEGQYHEWTRDKYTDVVRILYRYGARMVGFDVYFIEPSARSLSEQQLRSLRTIDSTSVMSLLDQADYDQNFSRAIRAAGNVYLAQFMMVPTTPGKTQARSSDQEAALAFIRQHAPRLVDDAGSLWQAVDFEPPVKLLREAARGFAHAQTVADPDGARRRYPLVYQYEDVVFPSIALLMVCDYLQVPIETVEVRPGDDVCLPGARFPDGHIEDIHVPIDRRGNMYVNWAGQWDETFTHYSHYGLRQAARREERQQVFDKLKELLAANPALGVEPGELLVALAAAGFTDHDVGRAAMATWHDATGIEQALRQNPQLGATEFWKAKGVEKPSPAQTDLFSGIQRTNQVATFLEAHPQATSVELQAALPQWDAEGLRQSAQFVGGLLVEGRLPAAARPLFFYPYVIYQGQPLLLSDLKDKILFYGLTAANTTDLGFTPFQGSYPMVGIYPNVFNTILSHSFIHRIPVWLNALLILGIGVLLSLVIPRFKVLHGALLVAGLLGAYVAVALLAFTHANFWLEVLGPVSALVIGYLAMITNGYLLKEKEKGFVQSALMREMEKELQTAHDMQMALMPQQGPQREGFEFVGRCTPANHVGGDLFQYFQQDGKLSVVLADVTGHAMAAAIPVVMFSGVLDAQMQVEGTVEELFSRLNRSLHRTLTGRTFVCLAMGELDPGSRLFRFSDAGCPYPYHYRAATGEVTELQVDAYPLGVRPDTTYRAIEVQLAPGDRVVFCSDGIIEAANEAGEMFGFERTAEVIRRGCQENLSAEALLERIMGEVTGFRGETPQGDDQTVVVVAVEQ